MSPTNRHVADFVRQTPVIDGMSQLTVSMIRAGRGSYETVIFDDSPDRRHDGQSIDEYIINYTVLWAGDRESAMEQHRDAVCAARTGTLKGGAR